MPDDFLLRLAFDDWPAVVRVAVSAACLYVTVLILNRLHGTRTTSKMNNFDWLVAVAAGTIFGSTVTSKSIPLADGLTAIVVLAGLQWIITKASAYSTAFFKTVVPMPALLFEEGRFLDDALKAERVARSEVLGAVRAAGVASLAEVSAVVLESDGSLSVLPGRGKPSPELLAGVRRPG